MASAVPICENCVGIPSCPNSNNWPRSWCEVFCLCCGGTLSTNVSGQCNCGQPDNGACSSVYPGVPNGIAGQFAVGGASASDVTGTYAAGSTWTNVNNALADDGVYTTTVIPAMPGSQSGIGNCTESWSDYIVITGLGFSLPAGSTIYGIVPGIKAHASATPGATIYNVLLTYQGNFYYMCDPRDNFGHAPSGNGYVASPYGSGEGFFYPNANTTSLDTTDSYAGGPYTLPETQGTVNCYAPGNLAKNSLTPAKFTWQASEVNDASFGVGFAFENLTGHPSTTCLGGSSLTVSVDTLGVAVYYTGPGAGPVGGAGGLTGRTRQTFNVFDKRRVWGGR